MYPAQVCSKSPFQPERDGFLGSSLKPEPRTPSEWLGKMHLPLFVYQNPLKTDCPENRQSRDEDQGVKFAEITRDHMMFDFTMNDPNNDAFDCIPSNDQILINFTNASKKKVNHMNSEHSIIKQFLEMTQTWI